MLELILKRILASKVRQKRSDIIGRKKSYCKLSVNSLAMMTEQKITINYIDQSSIKSDAKKIKYYQTSKKVIRSFRRIYPAMITKHQI